ncbi:hypothetical protein CsatB_028079 [Cannabis sativa]
MAPPPPIPTALRKGKRWRAPRPYVMRKKKNMQHSAKVAKLEKEINWLQDWIIEARPRKDGIRHDYYYYHKASGQRCRSLVEVYSFHSYGYLPRKSDPIQSDPSTVMLEQLEQKSEPESEPKSEHVMMKKTNRKKRSFDDYSSSHELYPIYENSDLVETSSSSIIDEPPMSIEEFLRDSYNNLMNTPPSPNSSSESTHMDKKYVEDFLRDSYNNLIYSIPASMQKSSKGYKKRRVAREKKSSEEKSVPMDIIVID